MDDKLTFEDLQSDRKKNIKKALSNKKLGKSPETLRNERVGYSKVAGKAIIEQYSVCEMNLSEAILNADIKSKNITPALVDLWRKTVPDFNEGMRNVELDKFYQLKSSMFIKAKSDPKLAKIYFDVFGLPGEQHLSGGSSKPAGAVGFTSDAFGEST